MLVTTFEKMLRKKIRRNDLEYSPDFRIVIQSETEYGVKIMMHALGEQGKAVSFYVRNNEVRKI